MTHAMKKIRYAVIALAAFCPNWALGNPIYTPVVSPVTPMPVDQVPDVARVPGKLFTDSLDTNYLPIPHAISPTQIGEFDGLGGARNGLRLRDFNPELGRFHLDAQSQVRDLLYDAVVNNRAPLVVSTSFDQQIDGTVALAAERTGGSVESFATTTQVVNHPHVGGRLRDINSVDLWGPEGQPHAGFYSFGGDPNDIAVYSMNVLAPGGVRPYLTSTDIAGALGNTALRPLIDVDAVMVRDVGTGLNPFDGEFGPGDSIMFSIAPIPNPEGGPDFFDGGEIWVWEHGQQAEYLQHGGHVWNTAFDVQAAFGSLSENIDALEAVGVPEPTTIALAVLGVAGVLTTRRRHIIE